ncbi:MAG: hypothetical protein HN403_12130 [Rhodospirillales bacterium]|nr:hypothetical protein [Rhodospirillales bacterium]
MSIDQQIRRVISKGLLIRLALSIPITLGGMEAYELWADGGVDAITQPEGTTSILIQVLIGLAQ